MDKSPNEGYKSSRLLAVLNVLISEEVDKVNLLAWKRRKNTEGLRQTMREMLHIERTRDTRTSDPSTEESPENKGKCDGAQWVAQQDLRAHCPVIEAEVGGMPHMSNDSSMRTRVGGIDW